MCTTIHETVDALLGTRSAVLPLTRCRVVRPYLLDNAGIGKSGTAMFFAVPYLVSADIRNEQRNISLYAVPRDYHGYIKQLSETVLPSLREAFPAYAFALFSDHSPVDEVNGAARAGLGVIGQNGLLITDNYGSFVFIAEVVTDAPFEAVTGQTVPETNEQIPSCIGCGACLRACPGHCMQGDKTNCLSALTQKKGVLTLGEQRAIQSHPLDWGCDVCQAVCPMNRTAMDGTHDTPIAYFRENRLPHVTAADIESMDKTDFAARAYAWRGKATVLRNINLHDNAHKEDSP